MTEIVAKKSAAKKAAPNTAPAEKPASKTVAAKSVKAAVRKPLTKIDSLDYFVRIYSSF
jgi:hypothetical protein